MVCGAGARKKSSWKGQACMSSWKGQACMSTLQAPAGCHAAPCRFVLCLSSAAAGTRL